MKTLYRFHFDCGRMGSLKGIFIADSEEVENAIGEECYFGEVLGKHSDIFGPLEEEDVEEITTDPNILSIVDSHDLTMGYNPLDYITAS